MLETTRFVVEAFVNDAVVVVELVVVERNEENLTIVVEAPANMLLPDHVLKSERRVEEAEEPPVVERVVPTSERPEPIVSVLTDAVPLPIIIPESVVEPVPPFTT